jgi:4-amino-4-deoxy-L-arabinose transferase-like glycosyltransferase
MDALQRLVKNVREPSARGTREWMELGLAWGVAVLLRQQALLLVPLFLAWLLWATWGHIKLRRFALSVALSLGIVAAFILPWTIRNYVLYGDFLPLNSNVGYALYAANHPQQGSRFEPLNLAPVPEEWRGLNEAELNSKLTAAGIGFVLDDPGRFALQTLDRFRNYFRFWPEKTSSAIANVSRVLSYGLYLPFMLYGLLLSLRLFHSRPTDLGSKEVDSATTSSVLRCPHGLILLYLYVVTYSAIHLLSWAMHRYRLPVDAVMMVFVGLALVDVQRRLVRARKARVGASESIRT